MKRNSRDRIGKNGILVARQNGDRLGPERLTREAIRYGGLVELPDDQVDLSRCQQRQQVSGTPLLKSHFDVRIVRFQPA